MLAARAKVWIGVLIIGTMSACTHRGTRGLDPEAQEASAEPVILEVENHNWSDINIFVQHDGRVHRLVMVTAATDASVPIPIAYQGEQGIFRLLVVRIGGRDSYRSPPISIRTGNTVRLTVESDLARSSVGVW